MSTYVPKLADIKNEWWIVDAEGLTLGRLATEVASRLRGKHKPTFTPHLDTGDHVVVVNAEKVVLTGNKLLDKRYRRHSGYPGGLKSESYGDFLSRRPADAVRKSVVGMLPKNRLGRQQARKLKIYAGPTHPHAAQKPAPLDIPGARRVEAS